MIKWQWAMALWALSAVTVNAAEIPADKRITAQIVQSGSARANDPMRFPTDVAVDRAGSIYVADGVNNRIARFDSSGQFDGDLRQLGSETLSNPIDLCFDSSDRLWSADNGNHRVLVASNGFKIIRTINLPRSESPIDVTGVAISANGTRTLIIDNDHHRVLIRDNTNGTFTTAGGRGRSLGQLEWPFMVAACSDGSFLISEAIGAHVQRLDAKNRWTQSISGWGVELGKSYRPKGIATDEKNRIYLSDSTLGTVQVFGPRGETLGVLTDDEGRILRFEHPMGLCFDGRGRLLVVESRPGRVAVVELNATFRGES